MPPYLAFLFFYRSVGRTVARSSCSVQLSDRSSGHRNAMVPTTRHGWDNSSKEAMLLACAMTRRWAPLSRYTLWRIQRSSILKIESFTYLVFFQVILKTSNFTVA